MVSLWKFYVDARLGNAAKARYLARAQPHLLARVPEHLGRNLEIPQTFSPNLHSDSAD